MKDAEITYLLALIIIILAVPLLSAEDYGAGTYGSGVFGTGEIITSPIPSGGGGGGGSSESPQCTTNSQCAYPEACWNGQCVQLFDVEILDFESPIKLGDFFEFEYLIKGMADINNDVTINFWVENNEKERITEGQDVIYLGSFETKTRVKELYLPSSVKTGTYKFSVTVSLNDYAATSFRTIEIIVEESTGTAEINLVPELSIGKYILYGLLGLALFFIMVTLITFYMKAKLQEPSRVSRTEKPSSNHTAFWVSFLIVVVLAAAGLYFLGLDKASSLIEEAINWTIENYSPVFGWGALTLVLILLAILLWQKLEITEKILTLIERIKLKLYPLIGN